MCVLQAGKPTISQPVMMTDKINIRLHETLNQCFADNMGQPFHRELQIELLCVCVHSVHIAITGCLDSLTIRRYLVCSSLDMGISEGYHKTKTDLQPKIKMITFFAFPDYVETHLHKHKHDSSLHLRVVNSYIAQSYDITGVVSSYLGSDYFSLTETPDTWLAILGCILLNSFSPPVCVCVCVGGREWRFVCRM